MRGEKTAIAATRLLRSISNLVIDYSEDIIDQSGSLKCNRAISLADCMCIALATKYNCSALFARKEQEIDRELRRKQFDAPLVFLSEE